MKARRVIVTLEMTTSKTIKELKTEFSDDSVAMPGEKVHQVQVNVVKQEKK